MGKYTGTGDQADLDNHANQLNPNNDRYQGGTTSYTGIGDQADLDNHANQLNPNNPAYASSRGAYEIDNEPIDDGDDNDGGDGGSGGACCMM